MNLKSREQLIEELGHLQKEHNDLLFKYQTNTLIIENKRNALNTLLDIIPDLIFLKDTNGVYVNCNQSFCDFIGLDKSNIIGKTDYDILPNKLAEFFRQKDNLVLSTKTSKKNEECLIYPNGKEILVETIKTPYFGDDGNMIGLIGVSRDITEYRRNLDALEQDIKEKERMTEELRKSEERFMKAFQHSPTMITINSLQDGRFIDVNLKWIEVMGYCSHDVIGRLPIELDFHITTENYVSMVDKVKKIGRFTNERLNLRSKDRRDVICLVSGEPIEIKGEQCLLLNLIDMTEYYNLESELIRLERLNLIGQLAAGLGHEIRNPLQTVRGFLQLLQNKYKNEKEYYDLMISELDRTNYIITEFLSLSKNRPDNPKLLNINNLLNMIFPLIQSKAFLEDKDVRLELQAAKDIYGDEKELKQLILNLAQNGIEAMKPTKVLTINTFEDESNLILAVKDQGRGIEPEIFSKLGTPFVTSRANGTGLGLAVCYSIAERHNARIEVETSSAGTTFYVKFPIKFDTGKTQ
ncbi:PAS domain S-box protein [Heliobacterium chlorum]|nr:PAS domain S-box protein [Heliobacterium chlorum]